MIIQFSISLVLILFNILFPETLKSENLPQKCNVVKNIQKLKITTIPDSMGEIFKNIFAKQVDVFGLKIYATKGISDSDTLHAAYVQAEYLDNDEDGLVDDPLLVEKLLEKKANIVIFKTEAHANRKIDKLDDLSEELNFNITELYGNETFPKGSSKRGFDSSLEEILHSITHYGYSEVYPEALAINQDSILTNAMDIARGGRFKNVPRRYPKEAWYTYNDRTCDYECQAVEYFYWGLTSYLGAQNYPGRFHEIKDEWTLNTPEKFQEKDKELLRILTNREYLLPSKIPNGKYLPSLCISKK